MDEEGHSVTVQDPSGSSEEILQLLKHNFGSRSLSLPHRLALQRRPISLLHPPDGQLGGADGGPVVAARVAAPVHHLKGQRRVRIHEGNRRVRQEARQGQ